MPADPDFDAWFKGAYQRALDALIVPGEPDASWDRKAAYLLWREKQPAAPPAPAGIFE